MNEHGLDLNPAAGSAGERHRRAYVLIHAIVWSMFILFPFLLIDRTGDVRDWAEFLRRLWIVIPFMLVFYANYAWLIPACLFRRQKAGRFILANLLLIALLSGTILAHNEWRHRQRMEERAEAIRQGDGGEGKGLPVPQEFRRIEESPHGHLRLMAMFLMRDFLSLAFTAGLAVALKTTRRWREAEASRRELEQSRTEAELRQLKSQLNPHFLLNTLNNIYALIAFDTGKAQEAVHGLSKLLRYVLYDNQADTVPLAREVDFVRHYIDLMRIRLRPDVALRTSFRLLPGSTAAIAPLLFISLIENAFKHGVAATGSSFIHIDIEERPGGTVVCHTANSLHPKGKDDRSGSGIGLEQVARRLELLYPGRYLWQHGPTPDGQAYESTLTIALGGSSGQ